MTKSAATSSINLTASGGGASWRTSTPASELLRPGLLYVNPHARSQLGPSQAQANLERFQREFNPNGVDFAREMSAAYFEDEPGANLTGAVAFVGCKVGQNPNRSLPVSVLIQLAALERFGRAHPDVAPFALVGLETANRGLVKSGSNNFELLCRFAFKASRFIEQARTLFSRVTPVLDCEVLYSADALAFTKRRKEQDVLEPDRVATAVTALSMSTSGVQVKIGASSFRMRKDIETAMRFPNRDQRNLFLGQTIPEDRRLRGKMAFVYSAGPASQRFGQLVLTPDDVKGAAWLQVDHLSLSEAEFRVAWQEQEQIAQFYNLVGELDPALSIVDESLAWALDCSKRMLDFHDAQLYEMTANNVALSSLALSNLKRDYSRAMRTYLRDLAARNFDWLLSVSEKIGFQIEASQHSFKGSDTLDADQSSVVANIGSGNVNSRSKAA